MDENLAEQDAIALFEVQFHFLIIHNGIVADLLTLKNINIR